MTNLASPYCHPTVTAAIAAGSAHLGTVIGSSVIPVVGTVLGFAIGYFVGEAAEIMYEENFEDKAIDFISGVFDLFGM